MKHDTGNITDYTTLIKVIEERRSVRRYRPELPDRSLLSKLIEAAHYAPSSTNFQPWMFLVVSNRDVIGAIEQAVAQKIEEWNPAQSLGNVGGENIREFSRRYFLFFSEAPVMIAVCCKPYPASQLWENPAEKDSGWKSRVLSIESTSAAVQNMLLAAHTLGLGACWTDGPLMAKREIESILRVEEPWEIMGLVTVGFPAETPPPVQRKDIKFISRFLD